MGWKFYSFLLITFTLTINEARAVKSLAALGDSLVVGSGTSDELVWDLLELEKLVLSKPGIEPDLKAYTPEYSKWVEEGSTKMIPAPTRYWEKANEYKLENAVDLFKKEAEIAMKRKYVGGYLDIEEYGWAYLVGRSLGLPANKIFLTAEGGNRISDALRQAKRLLKQSQFALPDLTLLFFTGNDLCSYNLNEDPKKLVNHYSESLLEAISYLAENGKIEKDKEAHIVVLGHLDVSQLLTNRDILKKTVFAFGKKQSCEDFRNYRPGDEDIVAQMKNDNFKGLLRTFFPQYKNLPAVKEICQSLFSTPSTSKDYGAVIEKLGKISKFLQLAGQVAVEQARAKIKKDFSTKKVKVSYLDSSTGLRIDDKDIANDCFHLSLAGQEKLASSIRKEVIEKKIIED